MSSYGRTLSNVDEPRPQRDCCSSATPLATEMCVECAFQFQWTNAPYSDSPFSTISIEKTFKKERPETRIFTPEEERAFFEACDDWQRRVFLILALYGFVSKEFAEGREPSAILASGTRANNQRIPVLLREVLFND